MTPGEGSNAQRWFDDVAKLPRSPRLIYDERGEPPLLRELERLPQPRLKKRPLATHCMWNAMPECASSSSATNVAQGEPQIVPSRQEAPRPVRRLSRPRGKRSPLGHDPL
uniref:Uncharacterized protein n=1 Tax=Leersia perrieri TaxID=77586 RepID=A0A0D9W235_9ORYZ